MQATLSSCDILERLVAFDTTSRDGNIPLIEWIEGYLESCGVSSYRVDYEPGKKTNLFATIGADIEGGIVLSGHTDVVPVDGQDWASHPFELSEREGRYYGRGTCDMKGFISSVLAAVPHLVSTPLKRPVHLAFSCDEEVGCKGVRPLIAHLKDHLPKPMAAIIGEPTSMQVVNAHKSAVTYSTEVLGHEAHSSCTHLGVNAIMIAGELLSELSRIRTDLIREGDPSHRFSPPYSTLHVGLIEGGTAKNIIPRRCSFQWETRLLPGADPHIVPERLQSFAKTLEPAMKQIADDTGIDTRSVNTVPGLAPEPGSEAETLALRLAHANGTHAVSYCTEAGLFQQIGIPSIVCGPGSIEQAHKPDEYLEVSQLEACDRFIARVANFCAA
jgi:acetylornithine deacetylase